MRFTHVLAGVLLAVPLLTGCQPEIRAKGMPTVVDGRPECPHHWNTPSQREGFALPGRTTNVPEFHDCQRLRIPGTTPDEAPSYGPIAAVFAPDSASAPDSPDLALGAIAGYVYLPVTGTTYAPLKLTGMHSCLLIRDEDGSAPRAYMVPADSDTVCVMAETAREQRNEFELSIVKVPPPVGPPTAMPRVARWDWDDSTKTQVIGIPCAESWCVVGRRDGFRLPDAYADNAPGGGPDNAFFKHRGAYDEQHLAELVNGELVPTDNYATIVPTPDLVEFNKSGANDGEWTRVARIFMRPGPGAYDAKFNFVGNDGPPRAPHSTLYLCHAQGDVDCVYGDSVLTPSACTVSADGKTWFARVGRPGGSSQFFCVIYRRHPASFSIPPVVRWRWRENDETIWVSCRAGCCEVNAI